MSRGFGTWQRLILAALGERECFYLRELLPPTYRKAQYNALSRAVYQLVDAGLIDVHRYLCGAGHYDKVLVARLGTVIGERPKCGR